MGTPAAVSWDVPPQISQLKKGSVIVIELIFVAATLEFSLHLQYWMLQQRKEKLVKYFHANKYECFHAPSRILMLGSLCEYLYYEYFTYSFPFEIN